MDNRIFRRSDADPERRPGWTVDLSQGDTVNPDCYWHFSTRKAATVFLALVDQGLDPEQAQREVAAVTSGTAPDTSLHLGAERKGWLAAQGGIQPTILKMIDEAMSE